MPQLRESGRISTAATDYPERGTTLAEHHSNVAHKYFRLLMRSEVSAFAVLALEHEVSKGFHLPVT